ncbi:MAG: pentapeptide repeat-containing protein [Desulfosarcina sp.]|nr:pentapeptide repeat-containing protein [Desulfobacterales bacterium]
MKNTQMVGAQSLECNFSGADLTGADLTYAEIRDTKGLTQQQLSRAK